MRKILLISVLFLIIFSSAKADDLPPPNYEYYSVYIPFMAGGNWDLNRFVSAGYPFYPEEWELWCNLSFPCTEVETLDSFIFRAPPGKTMTFVRLYLAFWAPPDGAHIIYPFDGCAEKICVRSLEGNLVERTATLVEVYIDPSLEGWGGPVHLADFMYQAPPRYTSITVIRNEEYDPVFSGAP